MNADQYMQLTLLHEPPIISVLRIPPTKLPTPIMTRIFGQTALNSGRRIISVAIMLLAAGVGDQLHAEKEYCSLTVRVMGPEGQPLVASVTVRNHAGNRRTDRTSESGMAEFCDLGIKPVDVIVGGDGCGEVTIRDVELVWGKTIVLPVTYSPCWLRGDGPPMTACLILLRFSDKQGLPISDVTIRTRSGDYPGVSDRYGRILTLTGFGTTLEGTASGAGFQNKTFAILCSRSEAVIEREVVLEAKKQN